MKTGVPPTPLHDRAGLFTPPGIMLRAAEYNSADRLRFSFSPLPERELASEMISPVGPLPSEATDERSSLRC